jgi:hypothetical protein
LMAVPNIGDCWNAHITAQAHGGFDWSERFYASRSKFDKWFWFFCHIWRTSLCWSNVVIRSFHVTSLGPESADSLPELHWLIHWICPFSCRWWSNLAAWSRNSGFSISNKPILDAIEFEELLLWLWVKVNFSPRHSLVLIFFSALIKAFFCFFYNTSQSKFSSSGWSSGDTWPADNDENLDWDVL